MLNDFIVTDKELKTPMYRQIYHSIRNSIENGSLKIDTKIPSIRRLSESLGVSKTTVTAAYDQLCAEGYIRTKPQSGFYVAAAFEHLPKALDKAEINSNKEFRLYQYDFSGKSIDENIMDLAQWKKCIKEVINKNYLLTSYGDVQGEERLRTALQRYALGTRSVNSDSSNIIVAAGTQPILYILCSVIGCGKRVALAKASFVQSEFVFQNHDYEVCYFESDKSGVTIESLNQIKPDIVLINPNVTRTGGSNMPVSRRLEIIEWAKRNNAFIIEDDYNGELRYSTHPMPCVQNYDTENTVYIGSFSKVLLPSVRIGYMVLPEKLLTKYNSVKNLINQTASKTEQLALAEYINSNKIEAHLRKARRIYLEKSKVMIDCVKRYFNNADIIFNETSLYLSVKLNRKINRDKLEKELEKNFIKIMPYKNTDDMIGLSFSGIAIEQIENGIKAISQLTNGESCVEI